MSAIVPTQPLEIQSSLNALMTLDLTKQCDARKALRTHVSSRRRRRVLVGLAASRGERKTKPRLGVEGSSLVTGFGTALPGTRREQSTPRPYVRQPRCCVHARFARAAAATAPFGQSSRPACAHEVGPSARAESTRSCRSVPGNRRAGPQLKWAVVDRGRGIDRWTSCGALRCCDVGQRDEGTALLAMQIRPIAGRGLLTTSARESACATATTNAPQTVPELRDSSLLPVISGC